MNLSGKVALVTGGVGGIGREVVRICAASGATVVVADLARPAADLEGSFVETDVSSHSQICALFSDVVAEQGRIDILVNCAGIARLTPVPDITPEEWDRIFAVNLKSVFFCSQQALGHMCAQKSGKIVNVASASGKIGGIAVGAHYAASKAGVVCLTKSLALYAAPHGINVNSVCPGPVKTPMTDAWGDELNTAFAEKIPFKRYATPAEVADAICFLISEESRYITGETVDVNGGLVMD